jgi:hypothetical protein
VRICLLCDEGIVESELFKITIGGVQYEKDDVVFYPDEGEGSFEDRTFIKWVCRACSESAGLYLDELSVDCCELCKQQFVPRDSYLSESVIRFEWGYIKKNKTGKGPDSVFCPDSFAHAHFACACDIWGLPLWNLGHADDF